MKKVSTFGDILEAADHLTTEEQENLIEILNRRGIERRRLELLKDIQDAQEERESGGSRPASPEDLIAEILS